MRGCARAGVVAACGAIGCSGGGARPQLLVFVDTDLPVHAQLAARPDLSADAAVDVLRVDGLPSDGSPAPYKVLTILAPDEASWPVSFGVRTDVLEPGDNVRLHLRAFAGARARAGTFRHQATLDPEAEVTVDRFVDVTAPAEGVSRIRVMLRGDCIGVLPVISHGEVTNCIDAENKSGTPTSGVDAVAEDEKVEAHVGTWPGAIEVPCAGAAPPGAVCIPGGYSVLGDVEFQGVSDGIRFDSYPLRPVLVSPFFLDVDEVKVGQMRALVKAGYDGRLPDTVGSVADFDAYCTWLGPDDATNDELPVNCLIPDAADAICTALGGVPPSEAQWEHAARGRGEGWIYPWGDGEATCCAASLSRDGAILPPLCSGTGPEAVGSHPPSSACSGLGDRSRDGVNDLAGSVSEITRDVAEPYDAPCWSVAGGGVLVNPVCGGPGADRAGRGGNWHDGLANAAAPFRFRYQNDSGYGVRCAYPDVARREAP